MYIFPGIVQVNFKSYDFKAGSNVILDFNTYSRAVENKAGWCWRKNRHGDQWNTLEPPEVNPHPYPTSADKISFLPGGKEFSSPSAVKKIE